MGRRDARVDFCHLCGQHSKLTFEHFPPKAAFNDQTVYVANADIMSQAESFNPGNLRGKQQQQGMGGYTLCGRCNNNTGAWYAEAFIEWTRQGARFVHEAPKGTRLYRTFRVWPLRVIKQILVMFVSVNPCRLLTGVDSDTDLRPFLLDRAKRYLPTSLRLFAYYKVGVCHRFSPMGFNYYLDKGSTGTFSEIAFPPMGYVLTFNGSRPPEPSFQEITQFSRFGYDERQSVSIQAPVLSVDTGYPGTYRSGDARVDKPQKRQKALWMVG